MAFGIEIRLGDSTQYQVSGGEVSLQKGERLQHERQVFHLMKAADEAEQRGFNRESEGVTRGLPGGRIGPEAFGINAVADPVHFGAGKAEFGVVFERDLGAGDDAAWDPASGEGEEPAEEPMLER
jgi:hypothetical protein